MNHVIYSLPFFLISFLLIILFRGWLDSLGQIVSGITGIFLGVISILIGIFIDNRVNR